MIGFVRKKKRTGWTDKFKMGLSLHNGSLAYGWKHGWIPWAPEWIKHAIVHVWNSIHCMIYGHDTIGVDLYKAFLAEGEIDPEPPCCVNCCTELPVDGVYVPYKEPWWKKPPTAEEIASWNELAQQPDLPEDSPDPS